MQTTQDELVALATAIGAAPDNQIGDYYDQVVAMLNGEPDNPNLRHLFGIVCTRARHYGIAKSILEPLLRTHGHMGSLRVNYGMVLDALGDYTGALHHYRHAESDAKVDKANLHSNRGSALIKLGKYEEADAACEKALTFNPQHNEALITKGFARLALGDLETGWRHFDRGIGGKHRASIDYGVPRWRGEPHARVIIHGEQGLGDEIMYASCIKDAAAVAGAIAIDCDARLSKLLRRSFPGIKVYGSRRAASRPWVEEFRPTHSIGIGSLPGLFRIAPEAFARDRSAYITPDPALAEMYRTLFFSSTRSGLSEPLEVIGIAWSGGNPETKEKLREIPLEAFAPLIEKYPHASFVSLQYREDAEAQIALSGLPIQHHHFATGKGSSYEHTAAAIMACDRVIGTDTTVIHAAGAMGVPVDCLLSTPSMWVWGPWQKDRAAWYQSVKLHRCPPNMDWTQYIRHLTNQGHL